MSRCPQFRRVPSRPGRVAVLVALLAALVVAPAGAPSATGDDALGRDLSAVLAAPAFAGADIGLVVRRADTGEVLFDRQGDRRRQPASNGKLLTGALALDRLGPEHRFRTTVESPARRVGPVLTGDLYLRGGGDPTMLAADYDALAAHLAHAGIRLVRGRLVADDTYFDDVRLGLGWAWDDEPYYYNAQISALTIAPDTDYDAGSVIVRVTPGAAGAAPTVEVEPPNTYVTVRSTATTGAAGGPTTLVVDREHGGNTITVTGSIPAGRSPVTEYMAVWEPTGLAAAVFRDALRRHGVHVVGGTATGATPPGAAVLAERRSMPVRELMLPFMKLSNNMHAEALVKEAGRAAGGAGSWPAGLARLRAAIAGLGVDPARTAVVDGSGLSRMDQVSPAQLAELLLAARDRPWFPDFHASLPVAGVADRAVGGTLRNRMRDTAAEGRVRAKTGTLTGVSALSGYVTAADGTELVFAMVSNQTLTSAKPLEDAVAIRLAQYAGAADRRQPVAVPEPRSAGMDGTAGADGTEVELECSWRKAC